MSNRHIIVEGINFPISEVDGTTTIFYPTSLGDKVTEEGKKYVEKLMYLLKEANPDIKINNDKPW